MAVLIVNDRERRIEYVAGVGETTFVYNWEIFTEKDIQVYVDEILLSFSSQYTVTNAGGTGGGDIVLVIPSVGGENIVITGVLAIDQTTDFTIKANFTGQTVQTQFNKLTMIAQQLDTQMRQNGLLYNIFADLKPDNQDNVLPVLSANQFWQMNATATGIFAAEFEIDPGANTLRSELISAQSGSDGAKIVGYFSPELGETTVHDQLNVLVTASATGFKNLIIGGDFSTNPGQRGIFFADPKNKFVADRFFFSTTNLLLLLTSNFDTSGGPTAGQTGIAVSRYLSFVVSSGIVPLISDIIGLKYIIEGYDWTRIFNRSFTFSFWMSTTISGIYSVAFASTSENYVTEITQPSGGFWTKHEITVPASSLLGNSTNGIGLTIFITFASGSSKQTSNLDQWNSGGSIFSSTNQVNSVNSSPNQVDFALFQIEPGTNATGFGVRLFAEELALCQRYFYKSYVGTTVPGTPSSFNGSIDVLAHGEGGANGLLGIFHLPVKIRRNINNAVIFNPRTGNTASWASGGVAPDVPAVVRESGDQRVSIGAAGITFIAGENYLAHLTADEEL